MAEGKKTSSVFFFGVVVVAALVVLGYGARQWWAGNTPYPSGSQGGPVAAATDFIVSEPSKPVPDASFTDPGGGMHKLTDFKGTYVLVNFWATWCAPCKTELPSLARLKAAVAPDKLKVMTISIDKNAQIAKKYLAEQGLERSRLLHRFLARPLDRTERRRRAHHRADRSRLQHHRPPCRRNGMGQPGHGRGANQNRLEELIPNTRSYTVIPAISRARSFASVARLMSRDPGRTLRPLTVDPGFQDDQVP